MKKKNRYAILLEDADILVVDKPAGMLSVPDRFDQRKTDLLSLLQSRYPRVMPVHRLDKDASGVICFARSENAHRILSQQFEGREVMKVYDAVVHGRLSTQEGSIEAPIRPHPRIKGKMVIHPKGKASNTLFRVIEQFRDAAWLEVNIITGRMHQIRIHCSSIGHALLVDPLYGNSDAFYLSSVKLKYRQKPDREESPLVDRLTLHARSLSFRHPVTDVAVQVEAPLPKDMKALRFQLRKWNNTP